MEKYGRDFKYEDFTKLWKAECWSPEQWAKLFKEAGAGYVVLTAKHHDGYCLFDSSYSDYNCVLTGPGRDIVGELSDAVRAEGIKMGLYYSGMIDWRFYPEPQFIQEDRIDCPTWEYADYAFKQSMELIDKYHPSVFWNDIGWPYAGEAQLPYLLAHYYNSCLDGIVDDRFNGLHKDFSTREYQTGRMDRGEKWEMCRGLGLSFGYNAMEDESTVVPAHRLIGLLVSTVANNGNLLINIGPRADGTIPEIQAGRLKALGAWLKINGEGIYGTKPAPRESAKQNGAELHFTQKSHHLYIFVDSEQDGDVSVFLNGVSNAPQPLDKRTQFEFTLADCGGRLTLRNHDHCNGAVAFRCPN